MDQNQTFAPKPRISVLGCGWLGMPLAQELVQSGYSVKGSTTSDAKLAGMRQQGIVPYLINLHQPSPDLSDFLEADVLIVAIPSKNLDAFRFLIRALEASAIRKVLFVSSTSVYPDLNGIVTEESETNDSALAQIENLFRSGRAFQTTIVRFGGLFGHDRNPGRFFAEGRKIDNPEGFVNLIHRDDCLQILIRILEQNIWQETLNACADAHPTRRAFYTREALKSGRKAPEFNETSSKEYKIINSDKLKTLLGYSFLHPYL